MSAILEALKRLEKQTAGTESEARQVRSLRGSDQARPVFLIAAGLVLLLVFGAGVWKLATLSATAPTSTRAEKPSVPDESDTSNHSNQVTATQQSDPAQRVARPTSDPNEAATGVREDQAKGSAKSPTGSNSQRRQDPQAETAPGATESSEPAVKTDTGESRRPDPAANGRAVPAQSHGEAVPEIMEDGPLTLQAISWAQAGKNRMAVINDKICRQGDRVAGYRVEVIHPEAVHVTDGKKTWRLIFRLR